MQHCVGSYANWCASGRGSIWSMRRGGTLHHQHVLTIEVDPTKRQIVTALGKRNARPKPLSESRRIMEKWAHQEGLDIASWV